VALECLEDLDPEVVWVVVAQDPRLVVAAPGNRDCASSPITLASASIRATSVLAAHGAVHVPVPIPVPEGPTIMPMAWVKIKREPEEEEEESREFAAPSTRERVRLEPQEAEEVEP